MNSLTRFIRWLRVFLAIRRIRKANTTTAKQTLAKLMAENRGLGMKVGQVMAGMQDDNDFVALTLSVKPWPLQAIIPVLEAQWQAPTTHHLKRLEESQAAASLGQVHFAQLKTGEKVAIKVQYPDIAKAIHSEINMINLLPSAGPVKRWGFDLQAYKDSLKHNMQKELDYLCEQKYQHDFSQAIHVQGLKVPDTYPELSTDKVLVQEWVEGVRLQEVQTWTLMERLYIGRTLMMTLFQSLFSVGLVHGDPHPGNLLYHRHDANPTVILLDYGCMIHIEPHRSLALLKLILSLRGECQQSVLDAFVALGFDADKLSCIHSRLPQLALILFQPFLENKACDLSQWHPGQAIEAALGEERWWFRAAGPADLFLLMRAFQGLVQQLNAIDVKLPWWPLLKQSVSDELLQQATTHAIDSVLSDSVLQTHATVRYLKVSIRKENETTKTLCFDAVAALKLDTIIPEHIKEDLDNHIDINSLQKDILENGLQNKILFDLTIDKNHYAAWVE